MINIYNRVHFMVSELYGVNTCNLRNPILDLVTKIHKEALNESIRQKRI